MACTPASARQTDRCGRGGLASKSKGRQKIMPRDISIGNGSLQVMFDAQYRFRDIYYPYVGKENHAGHTFRFGIFTDGQLSWTDSSDWERVLSYMPDTLVTRVELVNRRLKVKLDCRDAVDFHENIYLREVALKNLSSRSREITLFFHHDFHLYGTSIADTALYDPRLEAIVHYKGRRYFLANLQVGDRVGVKEWAIGVKEMNGAEGTWRDAEDGRLGKNPIAQGSVDSTIAARILLAAGAVTQLHYWIAAAGRFRDVKSLNEMVVKKSPAALILRTENYWRLWAKRNLPELAEMPPKISNLYTHSLLILRTLTDNHGGIIAANDSDLLQFGRDTYSYVWPRDGARAAYAFARAGYIDTPRAFFKFCADVLTEEGYLLHKYNPDGSFGSSWHPWYAHGQAQLPIQEDGMGSVLWALWQSFAGHNDLECVKEFYYPLIVRIADFLEAYRLDNGLPKPSYDLWEERFGVHTFTTAAVYGGLVAAANFAESFGERALATKYQKAANQMQEAALQILYSARMNRFARSLDPDTGQLDLTVDASLFGTFTFGLRPADDPMIVSTIQAVEERLTVRTDVGGIARYEKDRFCSVTDDFGRVPGNPWIVCTLWLAQYEIARAQTAAQLEPAATILSWVAQQARPTGVLPEQLHPFENRSISVCPLAWSHAEFIITVADYAAKLRALREIDHRQEINSSSPVLTAHI
jgi:glucoamylase